jgi:hypothetical protein
LSTYESALIESGVPIGSATPVIVKTMTIPLAAKGRNGILYLFFDLSSSSGYLATSSFNYGVYVDDQLQGFGNNSNKTVKYTQSVTSTAGMFGASGVQVGGQSVTALAPISIPVYLSPTSVSVRIGITNSSFQMYTTTTVAPMLSSNVLTSSGTPNTSNFVPQNTFLTTGTSQYTVPSVVQGGNVVGIYVYLWACGGGGGADANAAGGGGGFVSGFYTVLPGTVLSYTVGASGGTTIATGFGGTGYNGWNGGGFSAIFTSTTTAGIAKANVIALAGGGGGPGGGGNNGSGGGGGFPAGAAALRFWGPSALAATGGSQTAPGAGSTNGGNPGVDMRGGNAVSFSGGGGGGYFGGGSGGNSQDGGGGGSSFVGGLTGSTNESGVTQTPNQGSGAANRALAFPGGTSSPLYVSPRGQGNRTVTFTGEVVIMPAIGASPSFIAADARILAL